KVVHARTRSSIGGAVLNVLGRELTLADVDAAGERADVAVNTVVGNLQVVVPAVDEDTASALRAVGDGKAVNARRVALEVARERVTTVMAVSRGEQRGLRRIGVGRPDLARIRRVEIHALAENRDARALVGAHERRLLQKLSQVAVQ